MDEKAEQDFAEWWTVRVKGYDIFPSAEAMVSAKAAYLAADARATERTARRCVEICNNEHLAEPHPDSSDQAYDMGVGDCSKAIAKEFGLD